MDDLALTALLYQALAEPHGIVVKTNNSQVAIQKLYSTRRALMDPELAILQFRQGPLDPSEIWLVKTTGRKNAKEI